MLVAVPANANNLGSIRVTAERTVLKADGRASTIITAEVRDGDGRVVPDGTNVRFATTAGRLETGLVATQNGVARVVLTASDLPDSALVTVNLDTPGQAAPAQITITFATEADAAETGTNWVRLDGKEYTGYAVDEGIVQAIGKNGGAELRYRAYTIAADSIQLNTRDNTVLATGAVTISGTGVRREYINLRFDLRRALGVGEKFEEGKPPVAVFAKGPRLEESPYDDSMGPISAGEFWTPKDLSASAITVVAKSISLDPGNALQFRRATFYLDGVKTLSLPFHVMNLGQESLFREQIVGYGPQGITVDVPLYYDVRPSGIGTVHFRRGARVGSSAYSNRPGWSVDVEQAYNGRNGQEGVVEVTGLSRQDWSMRLRHSQRFGEQTHGSLYVDSPNHRDLFLTSQVSRAFKGFTLNMAGSGSLSPGSRDEATGTEFQGAGDLRGQIYAETTPRSIKGAKAVQLSYNLGATRQYLYGANAQQRSLIDTRSATVRLYTRPITLAPKTSLSQSLSVGHTWVSSNGSSVGLSKSGASIYGSTAVNHTLGPLGSLRLSYDYTQTPLIHGGYSTQSGRHRLGMSAFLSQGERWNFSLTASQGLDSRTASLFGSAQVAFGGDWRGRVTLSASRFGDAQYTETEFALIKRIAGRDFAVYYSTTFRRFQLDLTGARF
ncbi:MAG TPA: invasin domain 3-containing protein [Armatimonadaceae bacterium]|nr:invasin domain 3-containing protein [Armatimonadaceae bacterium]